MNLAMPTPVIHMSIMSGHSKLLRTRATPGIRALVVGALASLGWGTSCGGLAECEPGQACKVRGYVVVGSEIWAFQHCGSAVLLSVNVKGYEPGFEKLDGALHDSMGCTEDPPGTWSCLRQSGAAYVRMTATTTAPGHYGHSGKYERELEMTEIHEASSTGPADCAKVDPIFP